jgi:DNA polymerase-3 subunit delta'
MPKPIWDELLGQPEAIEQLNNSLGGNRGNLHHAWLFTGPAGSGRSNLARAFAAAIQCDSDGCGKCQHCSLVVANSHPDVSTLATDKVIISIDEVRELVSASQLGSSLGRYKILIIEDADRMTERTSNVLLKALEEPPENTIWMLCAPSSAGLLPTIRSRVRNITLRLPSISEVAELLISRDGVDPALARKAAAEAQSHVGMARRLALSSEARARREETIRLSLGIDSLGSAMSAAEKLLGVAKRDAESVNAESNQQESAALLAAFGLKPDEKVPPSIRPFFKTLEEQQKRRGTRSLRDGIDRIFTDLESVFRDVLSFQLETSANLINQQFPQEIERRSAQSSAADSLRILDAIAQSRKMLESNVKDQLVLETLCTYLIDIPGFQQKIAG